MREGEPGSLQLPTALFRSGAWEVPHGPASSG